MADDELSPKFAPFVGMVSYLNLGEDKLLIWPTEWHRFRGG